MSANTDQTETRRLRVGNIECVVILDCTNTYKDPVKNFFSGGTPEEVGTFLAGQGIDAARWNAYESPYPCMVVFARGQTILVDTGAGDMAAHAWGKPGHLLQNLAREGIGPEQIDTVILTHAHPDHVGGVLTERGVPRFPRARHVVDRREWEYWTGPESERTSPPWLVEQARRFLVPLKEKLEMTEGDAEIAPGVRLRAAYGHTPGHVCVELTNHSQRFAYISDLVIIAQHLQMPQWCYVSEVDKPQVLATRRALLAELCAERALVQAFHFPFPGLGHVVAEGSAWKWEPLDRGE